ncbi:hypothetical protein KQI33_14800 [Enterococcus devriesei]|uniref:hypothetical protein n=1 Tax=Enterococcus devriesei TaxID=319970 RepID=UPI001C0FA598|nr:hypothetical protein [Enterococcus devriesei]MBU5366648.1 hypothetical protein [Enterococcus devriesei]
MKFDSTVTISIGLALVALIAPSITAIINNSHAESMKDKDIELQKYNSEIAKIRNDFSTFLRNVGICIGNNNDQNVSNVKASGYMILPYISKEDIEEMKTFLGRFEYGISFAEEKALETYLIDKIIPILNKSLEKL